MKTAILLKLMVACMLIATLSSCGSRSRVITTKKAQSRVSRSEKKLERREDAVEPKADVRVAEKIVKHAKGFEGTRYKFGGTTKKGMDCSGLVYVSFLEEGLSLPRTSRAMSLQGKRLYLKEVSTGDLLFFETNKNKKVINHVGLVVQADRDNIYFIHSSTSRGVIISSLSETYWKDNFVMARRVI